MSNNNAPNRAFIQVGAFLAISLICVVTGIRAIPSSEAGFTYAMTFGELLMLTLAPTPAAEPSIKNEAPEVVSEALVDARITRIETIFGQYGSPMQGLGQYIVASADAYNINPYLIVAISGQESEFGKHCCGYNAWGYASCAVRFSSWEEAIDRVARLLAGAPYFAQNDNSWTIHGVGRIYAEDPNWPNGVSFFYQKLESI